MPYDAEIREITRILSDTLRLHDDFGVMREADDRYNRDPDKSIKHHVEDVVRECILYEGLRHLIQSVMLARRWSLNKSETLTRMVNEAYREVDE